MFVTVCDSVKTVSDEEDDRGALEKDEYIGLHRKLVRLVREGDDMTDEEESAMAEKEWKADIRAQGKGGKSMSKLTVRS